MTFQEANDFAIDQQAKTANTLAKKDHLIQNIVARTVLVITNAWYMGRAQ